MTDTSDDKPHAPAGSVNTTTPVPTAALMPASTPVPEIAPISVSGSGSQEAVKVHLAKGLSIFTIIHPGNGLFEVWLADRTKKLDRLVYEEGGFWGSKADGITAEGDYYLVVTANGVWSVNIDQPRPNVANSVPVSLSGTGQQVTSFFLLDTGAATFNMTHDGWTDFNVWLLDRDGAQVERIASTYGIYNGSNVVNITRGGIYLLDVQADGQWTVDVSQ